MSGACRGLRSAESWVPRDLWKGREDHRSVWEPCALLTFLARNRKIRRKTTPTSGLLSQLHGLSSSPDGASWWRLLERASPQIPRANCQGEVCSPTQFHLLTPSRDPPRILPSAPPPQPYPVSGDSVSAEERVFPQSLTPAPRLVLGGRGVRRYPFLPAHRESALCPTSFLRLGWGGI